MKNFVLCVTLNFLFFISTVFSIQLTPVKDQIVFTPKDTFWIQCNVSDAEGTPTFIWRRDKVEVTKIEHLVNKVSWNYDSTKGIVTLTITEPREDSGGVFSCVANPGKDEVSAEIRAIRALVVKVPTTVNVVEEEKLRIECKVLREPKISWIFDNQTYNATSGRVTLENYTAENDKVVINGRIVVDAITQDDRGNVTCIGEEIETNTTSKSDCFVRIKDKYAALWPFIGICAEVVILCAIIIVYEKKRNKTELEESDTDQSPDHYAMDHEYYQNFHEATGKNTPDHGKDANLRHRQ